MCEPGFSGEDCGFNEAAQPQYVEVYNSVCDVSKDDCSSAQVTGDGFIPNITSCQLQQVKVHSMIIRSCRKCNSTKLRTELHELVKKNRMKSLSIAVVHCCTSPLFKSRRISQRITSAYATTVNFIGVNPGIGSDTTPRIWGGCRGERRGSWVCTK